VLELRGIHKEYKGRGRRSEVLRGVNATFWRGDSVGILGRNGAGKSTLMKIIAGVDFPTSGTVRRGMSISWPLGYGGAVHGRSAARTTPASSPASTTARSSGRSASSRSSPSWASTTACRSRPTRRA
jgi:energy-coupling factor transporter ATP-binding protein EcfA2